LELTAIELGEGEKRAKGEQQRNNEVNDKFQKKNIRVWKIV
jgi:hypothetical protein